MIDIDSLIEMLDWNAPEEVQAEGRKMASQVKCYDVFLQPKLGKGVWENCALILSQKSDAELEPLVPEMLEWIADMNWPGAECIWDRLLRYKDYKWLNSCLNDSLQKASGFDSCWLNMLQIFKGEYEQQAR